MTSKRLFFLGLILWLILAIVKYFFFLYLDLNSLLVQIIFGFLVVVCTMACARRLGVINYLEACLAGFVWFFIALVLDFLITQRFIGLSLFANWILWAGYALVLVSVLFFHKKRHVAIRKEHAAHHGH